MTGEAGRGGGLLESAKGIARTLIAAAQTRLEILANELEEQRALLLRQLLLGVIASFCLGLAIVFAALFIVLSFPHWETRLMLMGLFALMFFAMAAALYWLARRAASERPRMLSSTMDELEKDRQSLL